MDGGGSATVRKVRRRCRGSRRKSSNNADFDAEPAGKWLAKQYRGSGPGRTGPLKEPCHMSKVMNAIVRRGRPLPALVAVGLLVGAGAAFADDAAIQKKVE